MIFYYILMMYIAWNTIHVSFLPHTHTLRNGLKMTPTVNPFLLHSQTDSHLWLLEGAKAALSEDPESS